MNVATTFKFQRQTFPATSVTPLGPYTVPTGVTNVNITVRRTTPQGLNSLPSTVHLRVQWYVSINGGPWTFVGGAGTVGGSIITSTTGQPTNTFQINISPITTPDLPRQVKLTVETSGGSKVVATGTVTLS